MPKRKSRPKAASQFMTRSCLVYLNESDIADEDKAKRLVLGDDGPARIKLVVEAGAEDVQRELARAHVR